MNGRTGGVNSTMRLGRKRCTHRQWVWLTPNDFQSTRRVRYGRWYGDDEDAPGGRSCRQLRECVTEFGAQGLELDALLRA